MSIERPAAASRLLVLCDTVITAAFVSDALSALDVASCLCGSVDQAFASVETKPYEAAIAAVDWPPHRELERAAGSSCLPIAVAHSALTEAEIGELTRRGAAVVVTLPELGDARSTFAQVIEYLETWRPLLTARHTA